jgi:hypothetical protein
VIFSKRPQFILCHAQARLGALAREDELNCYAMEKLSEAKLGPFSSFHA